MTDFQGLINNAIKQLRLEKGMSQEKFAERCAISVEGYRNIEHNRYTPKAVTINKICDAFNLSPIELLLMSSNTAKVSEIDKLILKIKYLNSKQLSMVSGFIDLMDK